MSRTRYDGAAFVVVVSLVVAVAAVPIGFVILVSGAPSSMILATVLAAIPVGPIVACYLWLDRYEPEPRSLLALALGWGAFVATAGALVVQGIGGYLVGLSDQTGLTVVAPVTEEAGKGLFLVLLMWWRRHELDGILDGIVYAGLVGLGFAFTENILYLAAAYNGTEATGPGGADALTVTFVLRCLVSPFAHPLFTTATGLGVGIAVASRSGAIRLLAPVGGYLVAVGLHAAWNTSTLGGLPGFFGTYVTMMMPVFVLTGALAVWARRNERRMLTVALVDAAGRGLIPRQDIPFLVDLPNRRRARGYAQQVAGPGGARAMREYQQAAVELGFLHHRILRGTAPSDYPARGQHYLNLLQSLRPSVPFPTPSGQVVTN